MKKIIIGIVAENNSGKSTFAEALVGMDGKHYSMRETIFNRYKSINGHSMEMTRDSLQKFSQSQKTQKGSHTFIEEAVEDFMTRKERIGIIESLRSPGEPKWMIGPLAQKFPEATVIIMGVTAPYEDRLSRFLLGGMGEIGGDLTEEQFKHHEMLVNYGSTDWEENVQMTLSFAHVKFVNANGKKDEAIRNLSEYIALLS